MTDLTFNIKKGDRSKFLQVQLKHETSSGSSAVDLDGASAKIYMRERGKRDLKIDGASCTITDTTNGYVNYEWAASDVDTTGVYEAEIVVTDSDSKEETFPENDDKIVVVIHEEM